MVWASLAPARDHMRPFRLIELVTGAALSVSVAPFAGQPVLADSIETVPIEAWNGDSVCRADGTATGLKPSAMSEGGCPEHAPETDETARARAYLIETATPGYTMTRQGPERAIGRLHPPISAELAKICRALAIKAHATQRAGSGTA